MIFCVLVGGAADATEPDIDGIGIERQEVARGYTQGQLAVAIGGAQVNAFNFNFSVGFSEPVTFTTPVNGGLSLSLARTYNSNWYTERWRQWQNCGGIPPVDSQTYLSFPRQHFIGLGWDLHLGRIYQRDSVYPQRPDCNLNEWEFKRPGPYAFMMPDGSEHVLYKESTVGGVSTYYTRDGSMIKAVKTVTSWAVFLPNGLIYEMESAGGAPYNEACTTTACSGGTKAYFYETSELTFGDRDREKAGWQTTKIRTRELSGGLPSSWVSVEYHDVPFEYVIKRVVDSHHDEQAGVDREVLVSIDTDSESSNYGQIVEVSSPVPATLTERLVATYQYEVATLEVVTKPSIPIIKQESVHLLKSVTYSSNSYPHYGFVYDYAPFPVGQSVHQFSTGLNWAGQLTSLGYPSGKELLTAALIMQ